MKKIFTLFVLLCTISVFAVNAAETYKGTLMITVDNAAPTSKEQSVIVTGTSDITLTIPGFSYGAGIPAADVVVTATKSADGTLALKKVTYGLLPILSAKLKSGQIINNECKIVLLISALGNKVEVNFDGTKQ